VESCHSPGLFYPLRFLGSRCLEGLSPGVELLGHIQELPPIAFVLYDPGQPSKPLGVIAHILNVISHRRA
jgi:hypothetical protein